MCPNIFTPVYTGPTGKAFAKSFGAPALITHECKVLSGWWTRNPGHCIIFLHMCPNMQSRASNGYSSPASSDLIRIDMEPRRSSLLEPAELIKMPTFQPTPWRQAKHVLSRQEACVNWAAARPVYTSDIPGQTSKLLLTSSLLRKPITEEEPQSMTKPCTSNSSCASNMATLSLLSPSCCCVAATSVCNCCTSCCNACT